MKAAIYRGIKHIDLVDLPMPTCDDNGIVVKNTYAAICGSDIAAYLHGGDDNMIWKDHEFGHEMASVVTAVGKNAAKQGIRVGDRLFVYGPAAKGDIMRAATVGGFSEYMEVMNVVLDQTVFRLPDSLSDKLASIIEPFTIGANAAMRLEPQPGKKAIVYGAGAIGLTAAVTLKYKGCQVVVVDLVESRLELARSLGLMTCNLTQEDYLERCCALLGSMQTLFGQTVIDCDYYVDAAGNQAVLDNFFRGAKGDAALSVVAMHHKEVRLNLIPLTISGFKIIGAAGGGTDIIRLCIEILASGKFPMENLITHEFAHKDIVAAFEQACNAEESTKVVIKYE